jgi:hypothetical protein
MSLLQFQTDQFLLRCVRLHLSRTSSLYTAIIASSIMEREINIVMALPRHLVGWGRRRVNDEYRP